MGGVLYYVYHFECVPVNVWHALCSHRRHVGGCVAADGGEAVQDLWATELAGGPAAAGSSAAPVGIVAADVGDPYALLLLSTGAAVLLAADSATRRLVASESEAAAAALRPAASVNA